MWYKIGTGLLNTPESVKCIVDAESFDEAFAIGNIEYPNDTIDGGQPYDETNKTDQILFKQARKISGKDYRWSASKQ